MAGGALRRLAAAHQRFKLVVALFAGVLEQRHVLILTLVGAIALALVGANSGFRAHPHCVRESRFRRRQGYGETSLKRVAGRRAGDRTALRCRRRPRDANSVGRLLRDSLPQYG